jgi:hypothetical protein
MARILYSLETWEAEEAPDPLLFAESWVLTQMEMERTCVLKLQLQFLDLLKDLMSVWIGRAARVCSIRKCSCVQAAATVHCHPQLLVI